MNSVSSRRQKEGDIAFPLLGCAALLFLLADTAMAQGCPNNFMDKLESRTETTVVKQAVADSCRGKEVRIRGTVTDVAKVGESFQLRISSAASGYAMTVTMRDPPATDLSKLQMGTLVTIDARMRDLYGAPSDYFSFEDGRCTDCRG